MLDWAYKFEQKNIKQKWPAKKTESVYLVIPPSGVRGMLKPVRRVAVRGYSGLEA
jgi:hypothetical protein